MHQLAVPCIVASPSRHQAAQQCNDGMACHQALLHCCAAWWHAISFNCTMHARLTVQDTENQGWQKAGPVQSGVPRHWGSVRCGCIEGVLATAILAGQHPDVWDAAGLLLREHYK